MKRYLLGVAALAVIVGGLFVIAPPVHAVSTFNVQDKGDVMLSKDSVHNGSYYATGQDITIDGTVKGDLYCAGQTVRINGTVTGDVICAAQKITVNGVVGQDVRSAAQIVTITGQVGGTLTSFAQDVEIAKGATVGGDLNGAAQSVIVDGTINRDVALASQKLAISGLVEGSAIVDVESLSLTAQPAIKGGLEYTSTNEQSLPAGAVAGKVAFTQSNSSQSSQEYNSSAAMRVFLLVMTTLAISAVILSLFIPRTLERSYGLVYKKPGMVILVGIAAGLGIPVIAGLMFISVVGIPLGLLALTSLGLLWLLAFPFAAYYLARALFGRVIHNVLFLMLAGAVLLGMLLLIPLVNVITFLLMMIIGVGGVIVTITNGYQKPRYSIVDEVAKEKSK